MDFYEWKRLRKYRFKGRESNLVCLKNNRREGKGKYEDETGGLEGKELFFRKCGVIRGF